MEEPTVPAESQSTEADSEQVNPPTEAQEVLVEEDIQSSDNRATNTSSAPAPSDDGRQNEEPTSQTETVEASGDQATLDHVSSSTEAYPGLSRTSLPSINHQSVLVPNMEPYLEEGSLDGAPKDFQDPTSSHRNSDAERAKMSIDSSDQPDTPSVNHDESAALLLSVSSSHREGDADHLTPTAQDADQTSSQMADVENGQVGQSNGSPPADEEQVAASCSGHPAEEESPPVQTLETCSASGIAQVSDDSAGSSEPTSASVDQTAHDIVENGASMECEVNDNSLVSSLTEDGSAQRTGISASPADLADSATAMEESAPAEAFPQDYVAEESMPEESMPEQSIAEEYHAQEESAAAQVSVAAQEEQETNGVDSSTFSTEAPSAEAAPTSVDERQVEEEEQLGTEHGESSSALVSEEPHQSQTSEDGQVLESAEDSPQQSMDVATNEDPVVENGAIDSSGQLIAADPETEEVNENIQVDESNAEVLVPVQQDLAEDETPKSDDAEYETYPTSQSCDLIPTEPATVCEADSSAAGLEEAAYDGQEAMDSQNVYVVENGDQLALNSVPQSASMTPYHNPGNSMLVEMAPLATEDGSFVTNQVLVSLLFSLNSTLITFLLKAPTGAIRGGRSGGNDHRCSSC